MPIFASLLQDKDLRPEEDGATRSKCRQDFCDHAGIGETVYLTCLSQLRGPHFMNFVANHTDISLALL